MVQDLAFITTLSLIISDSDTQLFCQWIQEFEDMIGNIISTYSEFYKYEFVLYLYYFFINIFGLICTSTMRMKSKIKNIASSDTLPHIIHFGCLTTSSIKVSMIKHRINLLSLCHPPSFAILYAIFVLEFSNNFLFFFLISPQLVFFKKTNNDYF